MFVKCQIFQTIYLSFMSIFITFYQGAVAQYFERVTIVENSQLNTVVLDIRTALVRHGEGQLPINATAYASQQETFWPFVLDNFVIKLSRPLDREAVCRQHQQIHMKAHRLDIPVNIPVSYQQAVNENGCMPGACCQLLHVNIVPSPTALPKSFFVQIVVQDVNDNPPRFPSVHSPFTVLREDIDLEQRIWLPQASDPDSPQFSVTEYRTENWIHGNETHFMLGVADELPTGSDSDVSSNTALVGLSRTMGKPYLTVTGPLDRETCDIYAFTLVAVDGGDRNIATPNLPNRALTGSVNIVIQLEDVNDNRPMFDSTQYKAKVIENSMTANVIEFAIVDKDIGENGRVTVSIQDPSGYAQRLFRIGLQPIQKHSTQSSSSINRAGSSNHQAESVYRGYLQLINHIDAERFPATLRFSLVANDFGQPSLSSRVEVQIQIVNVNDNAPNIAYFSKGKRLTDGRISLPEVNTPPRAIVVLVHVTDEDSPVTSIRCQMTHESDTFSLEEASGSLIQPFRSEGMFETALESRGIVANYRQFAIRTIKELDRETNSHYVVTVECTDAEGVNSSTQNASLYITVTDVNDHSPTFDKSAYNGRVAENSPTAEVHLSSPMRVTDADSGTNALITFSIFDLDDENNTSDSSVHVENSSRLFRIDSRSGRIWTVIPLDCESKSQYTLLVVATDSGLPKPQSSSATVYITVEDENDNAPEFTSSHYTFELAENSPGGTEVGRVEAIDRDVTEANRKLRYSLRGRVEDVHLISIDRVSGIIRTRRPIDRESRSSISLMVTAENEMPVHLPSVPSSAIPVVMHESLNSNIESTSNHQSSARASLVINILNVNDNRPEFTLIEPHRSHLTFIWEQLGVTSNMMNTSFSGSDSAPAAFQKEDGKGMEKNIDAKSTDRSRLFGLDGHPVCERLPHKVTDKDVEPDSNADCCILELLDDFDGLFALMPEAPNVLCVMRRPPKPKSYKLTLIAKDGPTNESLSSQVHFTVVIRSDPTSRTSDSSLTHGLSLIPPREENRYGTINKSPSYSTGNHKDDSAVWSSQLALEDQRQQSGGPLDKNQLRQILSKRYGTNQPARTNGSAPQTLVIVVMIAVAGILCVLLLLTVVLTRRCIFEAKSEQAEQPVGSIGLKSSDSFHSTPSKVQSCALIPVSSQCVVTHPDYYSKEMVYHHPVDIDDRGYNLTTSTMGDARLLLSPTLNRNIFRHLPTGSVLRTVPTLHQSSVCAHGQTSDPVLLETTFDKRLLRPEPETKINKLTSSPNNSTTAACVNSDWPPLPPSHIAVAYPSGVRAGYSLSKAVPSTSSSRQLSNTGMTGMQSVYQTIDFRMIPHKSVCSRPARSPTMMKRSSSGSEGTNDGGPFNGALFDKCTSSEVNLAGTKQTNCVRDDLLEKEYVLGKSHPRKLERTNSQRSGYLQTTFV
ncbi:Protocadherin Fat 1 [Paragonimus heterotremus]|uniref:Protocadherin Fat 1 n=1 Tax=Paragonimus heterotremus TaxID=100268 RepID=A0A8J4WLN0_9TREM|nr:Protocadherin Fat 1 [Paragonimus heterotremus]